MIRARATSEVHAVSFDTWNKHGDFSRPIHILIHKATSPKMLFSVEFASYFIFLILLGLLEPINSGHNVGTSVSGFANSSANASTNGSVNGSVSGLPKSSTHDHSRAGMVCLILFCIPLIPWTFAFGVFMPSWAKRRFEDGTLSWQDGKRLGYKTKLFSIILMWLAPFVVGTLVAVWWLTFTFRALEPSVSAGTLKNYPNLTPTHSEIELAALFWQIALV